MLVEKKSQNIHGIMDMFGLKQIINDPTRITPNSATLIHLILISNFLSCTSRGTIAPFCSDHHAIFFSTHFMNIKSKCYTRNIWQYDNADFNMYRQKLYECNWNMENMNMDERLNCIIDNITKTADQTIPNKTVTIRPRGFIMKFAKV